MSLLPDSLGAIIWETKVPKNADAFQISEKKIYAFDSHSRQFLVIDANTGKIEETVDTKIRGRFSGISGDGKAYIHENC